MDRERAVDDLKAIRQIMEQTRRTTDGHSGWFMILWGIIWFVGFLGSQFLAEAVSGWLWLGLDAAGVAATVWLAARLAHRGTTHFTLWRPLAYWILAVFAFSALLIWLLELDTMREGSLVLVMTIGLSFLQFGILSNWKLSAVGAGIVALPALAAILLPDHFFLALAVLGGGLLIWAGIWFVRQWARP